MFKRARLLAVVISAFVLFIGGSMFTIDAASFEVEGNNDGKKATYVVKDDAFSNVYSQLLQQWNGKEEMKKSSDKHNKKRKYHHRHHHKKSENNVVVTPPEKVEKEPEKKDHVEQPTKPIEKEEQPKEQEQHKKPEQPAQPTQPTPENNNNNNNVGQQQGELNHFEWQVFELTNKARVDNGLQPLQVDYELSRVAREKSRDMAVNRYFSHDSPVYGSPFDMMRSYGVTYRTAGENIARGQLTPSEVVNAWMNSPGHRANILNPNFTHIGLGYVTEGNHWTQQFIGK